MFAGHEASVAIALAAAVLSEVMLLATFALAVARPDLRLWPTHDVWSWRSAWVWGWIGVALIALLVLGILDWGHGQIPAGVRFGLGLPLVVTGNGLAWWGVAVMGWRNTAGGMKSLATEGPYRWLRHPQYVGDITILIGWPLFAGSWMAGVGVALGIVAFIVAIVPEEHAVRATFGRPTYDRRPGPIDR